MNIQSKKKLKEPIVVDLDGTLIKTDLLFESAIAFLKQNPLKFIFLVLWFFKGIDVLKKNLASRVHLDIINLPYNRPLLDYLTSEYDQGRTIVLATASHAVYAKEVASHLGIFTQVFATEDKLNLKGGKKLQCLLDRFGEQGFDYIGDSKPDITIFPHAKKSVLVNKWLAGVAKKHSNIRLAFNDKQPFLISSIKAIRIHQWLKNLLLLVPFFTSHNWFNVSMLLNCSMGFIAMGLCASGTYVFNDLLDIQSDRAHPKKKNRPLASGDISVFTGIVLSCLLLLIGLTVAFFLNRSFFLTVIVYLVITVTYSVLLKRYVMIDVISLASLYTIRVIAGAVLVNVSVSYWLLAFSIFIFFSLALVKRCTELQVLNSIGKDSVKGRDYQFKDLSTLRSMGIAGGFLSVVVFSLYLNSTEILSLYSKPQVLWCICPILLYWISRVWIIAGRGEMDDDPVVFAIKDKASAVFIIIAGVLVVIASYWK